MSEWWTYHLRDFLLFTPRTYYRLFELYNAAIWPAQVLALGLGAAVAALARRGTAASGRIAAGILAACWLFVALAFHAARYATINTGAVYLAGLFGLEAALLVVFGVVPGRPAFEKPRGLRGRVGLGIFLFALAIMPLAAPVFGRGWRSAEIFGVAPDPTAVGTLGILLLGRAKRRWPVMIAPALWCAITGATLYTMHAPDFWVAPAAAALAVLAAALPGGVPRRA